MISAQTKLIMVYCQIVDIYLKTPLNFVPEVEYNMIIRDNMGYNSGKFKGNPKFKVLEGVCDIVIIYQFSTSVHMNGVSQGNILFFLFGFV